MRELESQIQNRKREELVEQSLHGLEFESAFRDAIRWAYDRGWSEGRKSLIENAHAVLRVGEKDEIKTP